eukprot:COSAG01_NODE_2783_length_7084_cov_242.792269_8_plen_115_part_00
MQAWPYCRRCLRRALHLLQQGLFHHREPAVSILESVRSTLTEIYLCHARSCHEILRTETAGQELRLAGMEGLLFWVSSMALAGMCSQRVVIEAPWLVNGGHGASLRHHTCSHVT